jgi:hypothetical protein
MQGLFSELLWKNVEIDEAADRLRKTLPGFSKAEQAYSDLAKQIRAAAGPELYDQCFTQLMRYNEYEIQSYYSLGLGLRGEMARTLNL